MTLRRFWQKLGFPQDRRSLDRDIDDELRFHLEMRTAEYMREGMRPAAARRAARERFGDPAEVYRLCMQEHDCRPAAGNEEGFMALLWQDVRYAARALAKTPSFTVIAVLTLALGIGANAAIFSIVNAVLLEPLPYGQAERLVALWEIQVSDPSKRWRPTAANFLDWRAQSRSFEEMATFGSNGTSLTGEGEPEQLLGTSAGESYLAVLGVQPHLGRWFRPEEFVPGAERVVILGHGLWQRRFGGSPAVLGRRILLGGNPSTVVGVMPDGIYPSWPMTSGSIDFQRSRQQFITPLIMSEAFMNNRRSHVLGVIARLKPGVPLAEAQAEMATIGKLLEAHPQNRGESIVVSSLADELVGSVRPALLILFATVAFVLLVACANVASLVVARMAGRAKETAIRVALGASRMRVHRLFFLEGLLLVVLGSAAGIWLAALGVRLLRLIIPQEIPRLEAVGIDAPTWLFTLLLALVTSLLFGVLPALRASEAGLQGTLRDGGRTSGTTGRQPWRRRLVTAQVATAAVLLTGALLLVRSFWNLHRVDPGFNPDRVLDIEMSLSGARYQDWPGIKAFHIQLLERLASLPGIRSAALGYNHPLESSWVDGFSVIGRDETEADRSGSETFRIVSAAYFETMGIPILRGRSFTARDDTDHPGAAIISESMARKVFPNEDPLGRRLRMRTPRSILGDAAPDNFEIVGIAADVRFLDLKGSVDTAFYVPAAQLPVASLDILVRAQGDPLAIIPAVQETVWSIDADQPLGEIRTLESVVSTQLAQPRFNMLLMGLFGVLALILASIGIYGLLAYHVAQQRQEIGVRMALGAQRRDILGWAMTQGLTPALVGLAIGLAAALGLTRFLTNLLFEVRPSDPWTFLGAMGLLLVVALVACLMPARRAAQVDPIEALRCE